MVNSPDGECQRYPWGTQRWRSRFSTVEGSALAKTKRRAFPSQRERIEAISRHGRYTNSRRQNREEPSKMKAVRSSGLTSL
jgi:hypothetical protein